MEKKSKLLHQASVPDFSEFTLRNEFGCSGTDPAQNLNNFDIEHVSPFIFNFDNIELEEQNWSLDFQETDMLCTIREEAQV